MVDWKDIIITALAIGGPVVLLIVATARYVLERAKTMDADAEQRRKEDKQKLEQERDEARREVQELRFKIGILEVTANLVPELQGAIKELRADQEAMRQRLSNAETALGEAQKTLTSKQGELDVANTTIRQLERELEAERTAKRELETEVRTYEKALTFIGIERVEAKEKAEKVGEKVEPGESIEKVKEQAEDGKQ